MKSSPWRHRVAAPIVALLGLAGGSAVLVASSAPSVGAVTTVTTEAQLRTEFDSGSSIVLANDISLTDCKSGELLRSTGGSPLVLDGAGHTITQTCPGARVMFNGTTDAITLENVTITGGNVDDGYGGAGIHLDYQSDLTVLNSAIVNNVTCEQGGGIELDEGGNLVVKNSTIAGNTATDSDGGGIANVGDGTEGNSMLIVNSTVSNNTAVEAGGIEVDAGPLQLVYATVTDNTVNPDLTCPVTASSTHAAQGHQDTHHEVSGQATAGVPANIRVNDTGTEVLTSFGSLVAFPHGGPNCDTFYPEQLLANTVSQGWNYSDDDSCGFTNTASGDRQNAPDPMIGALSDNPPTTVTMPAPVRQTRLPLTGSPLIDAIPAASCQAGGASGVTTDERSVPRPQGPGCDIGAVEVEVAAPAPPPPPTAAPAVQVTPRFTG